MVQKYADAWKSFSTKKKALVIGSMVAFLLVVGGIFVFVTTKKVQQGANFVDGQWEKLTIDSVNASKFSLTPKQERKFGILSQETFVLKTQESQDQNAFKEKIIASKPVSITAKSTTEFEIKPVSDLGVDETVQISIKDDSDYQWTFQTAPQFKITDNLPRNEAKNVPINAGIEITFNNDSFEISSSSIAIEPKVDFRIEKHDQIATIVPLSPLKPKTVYKVSIKKGLSLFSSANRLAEDYSFSFQTDDDNQSKGRISLAKDFQEVFPDEPLITKVHSMNWNADQTISAEVYAFSSVEDFVASRSKIDEVAGTWMQYFAEENLVDTKNLSRVATADLKLQQKEQLQYLQLPSNLNQGLYLIQFWFDDRKKVEQLWVQSSSVVGYVSVGKQQTVVWANSSQGEAVGSSLLQVIGTGETHTINDEGIVYFQTPSIFNEKKTHYMKVTSPQNSELILPVISSVNRPKPNDVVPDDFWSYLYNERLLYKPNDTVHFWGVAKNRDTSTPPEKVDIYLDDELKASAYPLSDGSFIGSIQLIDEPIGYKDLALKVNGVTLTESYFQIADYVKPELKIEVEGSKKAIYAGESVAYKARVSFFDGTPASNLPVRLDSDSGSNVLDKSQAFLDKNGEVTFTYTAEKDQSSNYSGYESVTVSPQRAEPGVSDGYGSVYVYKSNLQFETKTNQNKDRATLETTIQTLDLDRINKQGLSDPVSGTKANQKVELTTTKTWWEQKETGTYYDFVEKVTRPTYDYIRHDETLEKKDVYTDANGKIRHELLLELNRSYEVELKTTDSQGNMIEDTSYFYYSAYQNQGSQETDAFLNMERDSNQFSLGEEVGVVIQKNGAMYQANPQSKFLFVTATRGKQEVRVSNVPEMKFIYETKHIPDIYIGSIIFNGRYYEEVRSTCKSNWVCGGYDYYNSDYFFEPILISYKQDDSELNVSIAADKIKYGPGEEAKITVKVEKNGNPVEDASVNIVMVDEALAAINGVRIPSVLSSLYKQTSSLIYFNYYSHKPVLPDGPQAERGGGGGDRDLFKDTAFFQAGKTDVNGEKFFMVTLPDNITNWLTYAQAVTSLLDAGQAAHVVTATKDFFMSSQFPSVITLQDSAFVAISPFGRALMAADTIPTEVVIYKGEEELQKNIINSTAFTESYANIPTLPMGSFKVAVRGIYGDHQDGIALPLRVIDSRLNFSMTKSKTATKGEVMKAFEGVNPAPKKPVKLLVTDEGKGKYYYDLYRFCHQESNRLERKIASLKADQILEKRFKALDCASDTTDFASFQSSDGGLRLVEWGASDLETTLWAVYVDPTPFNKEKLVSYFTQANDGVHHTIQDQIFSNWGLTLLGVPKVNELNRLSKTTTTYREKALSGLALYSAGEVTRAKEIYMQILAEYAYVNKPYVRIQADPKKADYDTYVMDTSYALLLGTLISEEYSDGLGLYLRDYSTQAKNIVQDIAGIAYIDTILKGVPDEDTVITFKTPTQNTTRNITKDGSFVANLKQTEINNFEVKVVEGKVETTINYFATPEEFASFKGDDRISLQRTMTKVKGELGALKIGDIMEIDVKYDFADNAPLGCYIITDYMPSGMSYIENPASFDLFIGRKAMMYPTSPNVMTGCAYNSNWWATYAANTSVYFARVTAVGKFIHEPAIIQSTLDPSIFQKTIQESVTVEQ